MKDNTVSTTTLSPPDVTSLLTGGTIISAVLLCLQPLSRMHFAFMYHTACTLQILRVSITQGSAGRSSLPSYVYSSFTQLLSEPSADDQGHNVSIREVFFLFFFFLLVPDVYSREFIEVDQSNRAPIGNTLKQDVPLLAEAICGPWSPSKLAMAVVRRIAQLGEFRLPRISLPPRAGPSREQAML